MRAVRSAVRRVPSAALALAAVTLVGAVACRPADGSPRGLYRQHCARCHGLDGSGNPRAVDAKPGLDLTTSKLLAAGERAEVVRRIAEGEGTMPAFGDKLTPEQIEALVDLSYQLAGLPAAGATNRGGDDDGS